MLLFLIALISGVIQAWIVQLYIVSAVMGQAYWDHFTGYFNLEPFAAGPNEFCFDYCAPPLPFIAGWIGIAAFCAGWIVLAYAWWKPRG